MRIRVFGGTDEVLRQVGKAWPEAAVSTTGSGGTFAAGLVWDAEPEELTSFANAQSGAWWLHFKATGLPAPVLAATDRPGVVVTNGRGTHGSAVAEHVLAMLLAHYKRLDVLLDAQRRRVWHPAIGAGEIRGRTVGIIGLGDLGLATARLLSAFGATVVGMRREGPDVPQLTRTYRRAELAEFLAQLDVLVIAAPLTDQTRGMIGGHELCLLPERAFVINVGRAPILEEDALVDAIVSGHLAGAALDVFATEPLPASSRLWSLPNVMITPHCADSTEPTEQRCVQLMIENIHRFRAGQPLQNVVDASRGY
ncbi:MAG TPA: D-2-hydroxyacid dehydrogenase [Candidatus Limnocylindrales bacterium]|nr:D-2-hydroxyacid dehydrogenase [Candidatus Limnocylindrales bacterium]